MERHVGEWLRELTAYPDRHVGGRGNRAATAFFAEQAESFGFEVCRTSFPCIEWDYGTALFEVADVNAETFVGPYSLPCDVVAPLVPVSSVEQLEAVDITGAVLLIHGELAAGQLMPKNFTFYNPESHKRVIHAIEAGGPAAVVAATGRDPGMVGSQYPFPLFEDGDFDIPNAYLRDIDGERLLGHAGAPARLRLDSRRVPTTAEHVVALRRGAAPGRLVLTAHIDSRKDSPGALDNASGVVALLCVAGMLGERWEGPDIEIVPFNGEDNYANPGEMLWVAENEGRFDDIVLGINIDDLGMRGTTNHVSFYGCPPEVEAAVRAKMESHPLVTEGPQWFQSDHAIFGLYGVPALALASSGMHEFMAGYAHTERDTIELVDPGLVVAAARFVADVVSTRTGVAEAG